MCSSERAHIILSVNMSMKECVIVMGYRVVSILSFGFCVNLLLFPYFHNSIHFKAEKISKGELGPITELIRLSSVCWQILKLSLANISETWHQEWLKWLCFSSDIPQPVSHRGAFSVLASEAASGGRLTMTVVRFPAAQRRRRHQMCCHHSVRSDKSLLLREEDRDN